jgi:hypothetical protein
MIKALDEDLVDNVNVSTATATVDLGIGVKLAASDWAVRFDNVLLDTL